MTGTLTKLAIYGHQVPFGFLDSQKVTEEVAALHGLTYSRSKSLLCTALWSLYLSWTKLEHLLPALYDVHSSSAHRVRADVSVCREYSCQFRATGQELCLCTAASSGLSEQQADSWNSCPNRERQNPKIPDKWSHSCILCEGKKIKLNLKHRKLC